MVLSREDQKLCFAVQVFQGSEKLNRLIEPATIVGVGVDDEERGANPRRIGKGRFFEVELGGRKDVLSRPDLIPVEPKADVGGAKFTVPVGDGLLSHGGLEPIGMAYDPVGHKAPIGDPRHAQTVRVNERVVLAHIVDSLHEVLIVALAVVSPDGVRELFAVTVAAAGVDVKDAKALGSQKLELEHEPLAIHPLRPPMDLEDARIFLPFL